MGGWEGDGGAVGFGVTGCIYRGGGGLWRGGLLLPGAVWCCGDVAARLSCVDGAVEVVTREGVEDVAVAGFGYRLRCRVDRLRWKYFVGCGLRSVLAAALEQGNMDLYWRRCGYWIEFKDRMLWRWSCSWWWPALLGVVVDQLDRWCWMSWRRRLGSTPRGVAICW
ncbi:hypothetical protein QQ045_014323 [Rhodiola kirilowii]